MPEDHACEALASMKKEQLSALASKLEKGQTRDNHNLERLESQ
jgi:predicted nucleic acid binding AN1-type Zn finger protein